MKGLNLAARQRRCLEIGYGAFCLLGRRASVVAGDGGFEIEDHLAGLEMRFQEGLRLRTARASQVAREGGRWEGGVGCAYHGHATTAGGFVLGEYAEQSARLFVKGRNGLRVERYYDTVAGVRHIHSVLGSGNNVFVTTGDASRFLDRWELKGGGLELRERVLRRLGGFTACCEVKGRHFFGTDLSERPNYIFCLETRQKWFFPKPAYTQVSKAMLPFGDRYILCVNASLWATPARRSLTVFDSLREVFVVVPLEKKDSSVK